MYCPYCRTELIFNARFCPGCGKDLQQDLDFQQASQTPTLAPVETQVEPQPMEPTPLRVETPPAPSRVDTPPAPSRVNTPPTPQKRVSAPVSSNPTPAPTATPAQTKDERSGLAAGFRAKQLEQADREGLGMKWYKFLVYFSLLASAAACIISLVSTASQYSALSEYISYYPAIGSALGSRFITYLVLTPLYVYTWYLLMRFSKKAIGMFFTVFWVNIALTGISQLFTAGMNSSISSSGAASTGYVLGTLLGLGIASVAYYLPNRKYFGKREHLFIND